MRGTAVTLFFALSVVSTLAFSAQENAPAAPTPVTVKNTTTTAIPVNIAASQPFQIQLNQGAMPLPASTRQFQKAVVVRVQKFAPTLPYRRRLSDSPAPLSEYDFELSLRVNCLVYVGLYPSAIDYLPAAIAPDQSVEVSVEKHLMYVKVPGDDEIKVAISRHYSVCEKAQTAPLLPH